MLFLAVSKQQKEKHLGNNRSKRTCSARNGRYHITGSTWSSRIVPFNVELIFGATFEIRHREAGAARMQYAAELMPIFWWIPIKNRVTYESRRARHYSFSFLSRSL